VAGGAEFDPEPTLDQLLGCEHRSHNLGSPVTAASLRLDPQLLYYRPPLGGIGLLQACKRLWRLPLA
jgi:hypothetical protein